MPVTDDIKKKIEKDYGDRFGVHVNSVQDGVDGVFGGSLIIATYVAVEKEKISDVVFLDRQGNYKIFDSTQELILFLQDKTKFSFIEAFIESRGFHAVVLLLLIALVFWAGSKGIEFDPKALAILGSVVGLAAGLFFGPGRK